MELTKETKTFLASLAAAAFLIGISFLSGEEGTFGSAIILSTFAIALPQLFFRYERYRELKEMESRFPSFLRSLTESLRSGAPLHSAFMEQRKFDFGPLSKEIKKVSNQLSWGMPLEKVLEKFAQRLRGSKRLFVSVRIIRESYLSGGNVPSILDSVADNDAMLDDAVKERQSLLSQYVLLMYAIGLIFVAIVVAINNLLIPVFSLESQLQPLGGTTLKNPCAAPSGFSATVCGIFTGTSQYVFGLDPKSVAAYYVSLFFIMSLIQSVFSGLVAGQISENSIQSGIKHSSILLGITVGAFLILRQLNMLGV